jgi:hypothetical protein
MPQPANFMNKFRYAILIVLVIVTVGYGWYLYRLNAPAEPPHPVSVAVEVLADGSVRIEGTVYASKAALAPKIAAVQREHPDAGFSITAPRGDDFNGIAKAVVLMRQSGANTVWVINESPKETTPTPAPR